MDIIWNLAWPIRMQKTLKYEFGSKGKNKYRRFGSCIGRAIESHFQLRHEQLPRVKPVCGRFFKYILKISYTNPIDFVIIAVTNDVIFSRSATVTVKALRSSSEAPSATTS